MDEARVFFAGLAMHAWLSLGTDEPSPEHESIIAKLAFDQADAMMKEMEARDGHV